MDWNELHLHRFILRNDVKMWNVVSIKLTKLIWQCTESYITISPQLADSQFISNVFGSLTMHTIIRSVVRLQCNEIAVCSLVHGQPNRTKLKIFFCFSNFEIVCCCFYSFSVDFEFVDAMRSTLTAAKCMRTLCIGRTWVIHYYLMFPKFTLSHSSYSWTLKWAPRHSSDH